MSIPCNYNYNNNNNNNTNYHNNWTFEQTLCLMDFTNLTTNLSNYTNFNDTQNHTICSSVQNSNSNLITMILYAGVCIIGLFGNTLVIYVVLRFSKMQTVTNMYILNLAIADECFLIGIPFLLITMYLGSWHFGENMCKAYMVSTSINQFTSSIFLFIMSADRYIAVCHPISSARFRTPFVSKIVVTIAWTTSAILILPILLFATTVTTSHNTKSCNIIWPVQYSLQSGTTFTLYSLIFGFAIPVSLMLCFYYLVIRKLHTVGPKNKSKEKKRSHRKVTKLVLTVVTVYVLCWLPYWISQVALINSEPKLCSTRLEVVIFLLIGCLSYSNSAINPILYAFLSDNFKKSFMKACTCATRKDINAQLQMENSFFPKFGKNRHSEKLFKNHTNNKQYKLKQLQQQQQQQQQQQTNPQNLHNFQDNGNGNGNGISGIEPTTGSIFNDQSTSTYPGRSSMLTGTTTVSIIRNDKSSEFNCIESKKPPILQSDL